MNDNSGPLSLGGMTQHEIEIAVFNALDLAAASVSQALMERGVGTAVLSAVITRQALRLAASMGGHLSPDPRLFLNAANSAWNAEAQRRGSDPPPPPKPSIILPS